VQTLHGGLLWRSWAARAPVAAAEIDVVASIKPVHSLVTGVMQGIGEPVLLVKGTRSEHSFF
jgi:zinc transport system substrate-binding protein